MQCNKSLLSHRALSLGRCALPLDLKSRTSPDSGTPLWSVRQERPIAAHPLFHGVFWTLPNSKTISMHYSEILRRRNNFLSFSSIFQANCFENEAFNLSTPKPCVCRINEEKQKSNKYWMLNYSLKDNTCIDNVQNKSKYSTFFVKFTLNKIWSKPNFFSVF